MTHLTDTELLYSLDIWNNNGSIDPLKLTPLFRSLTLSGRFDYAEDIIAQIKSSHFYTSVKVRIDTIQLQISEIKNAGDHVHVKDNYSECLLSPIDHKIQNLVYDLRDLMFFEEGLYKQNSNFYTINIFDRTFSSYTDDERSKLSDYGFARDINNSTPEKIRIVKNATLHCLKGFHAISDLDGRYDMMNCSRLARLTRKNFLGKSDPLLINKALVLPFATAPSNYYHNLSETVYGIRYAENISNDYKIVYSSDPFGALALLCEKMGIESSRLVSIDDYNSIAIKKAIHVSPIGFGWNSKIYEFFSRFSDQNHLGNKKIYISRRMSKRGIDNELDVEKHLKSRGFDIVYGEKLSFSEQVSLFSQARMIVGTHGAGMTNMIFMKKGGSVVEIFPETFIKPDFYYRSIHNEFTYDAIISENNKICIEKLDNIINKT